jgi:hypothetical protein
MIDCGQPSGAETMMVFERFLNRRGGKGAFALLEAVVPIHIDFLIDLIHWQKFPVTTTGDHGMENLCCCNTSYPGARIHYERWMREPCT